MPNKRFILTLQINNYQSFDKLHTAIVNVSLEGCS